MKILVTGAAGFIGFHVSLKLIERGDDVVGFDNVNNYYDPSLKQKRLSLLEEASNNSPGSFIFNKEDLADNKKVEICFLLELASRPNESFFFTRRALTFTRKTYCCVWQQQRAKKLGTKQKNLTLPLVVISQASSHVYFHT